MTSLVRLRVPRASITENKSYADETAEISTSPLFRRFVRPCVAEFIGTMIYTFASCLSFTTSTAQQAFAVSISQGLIVMALTATVGHISGAHLNPAVSLGVWIGGGMNFVLLLLYITIQILGAFIGALLFRSVITSTVYLAVDGAVPYFNPATTTKGQAILLELCCCFMWVSSVLMSTVDSDGSSPYCPLAVGCAVFVITLISFNMTKGSVNPARALAASITSSVFTDGIWSDHYIFWVGPLCGAIIAAALYRLLLADERNRLFFKR